MIKLLKNKEVRKALLWQLLLSAAACAVCFFFDIRAGLTAAGLSLLLMLIYCVSTYRRYQSIAALADDIDQILHGDHAIDFDSYSEGELSILHSEIYKMTIRSSSIKTETTRTTSSSCPMRNPLQNTRCGPKKPLRKLRSLSAAARRWPSI